MTLKRVGPDANAPSHKEGLAHSFMQLCMADCRHTASDIMDDIKAAILLCAPKQEEASTQQIPAILGKGEAILPDMSQQAHVPDVMHQEKPWSRLQVKHICEPQQESSRPHGAGMLSMT